MIDPTTGMPELPPNRFWRVKQAAAWDATTRNKLEVCLFERETVTGRIPRFAWFPLFFTRELAREELTHVRSMYVVRQNPEYDPDWKPTDEQQRTLSEDQIYGVHRKHSREYHAVELDEITPDDIRYTARVVLRGAEAEEAELRRREDVLKLAGDYPPATLPTNGENP